MAAWRFRGLAALADGLRSGLSRVEVLALFPALTLLAVWSGHQDMVLLSAMLLPGLLALQALARAPAGGAAPDPAWPLDAVTGLPLRPAWDAACLRVLHDPAGPGVMLVLRIDGLAALGERWGSAARDVMLRQAAQRLRRVLRATDPLAVLDQGRFGLAIAGARRDGRDAVPGLASRLQEALAGPIAIGGTSVQVTASIGYCTSDRLFEPTPETALRAATLALEEAEAAGPGAVRGYTPALERPRPAAAPGDPGPGPELARALEAGQIRAWFQPQISTDTGAISGMEALARWHHPERGVLPPTAFLDALSRAGLMPRLGAAMLTHALAALQSWDRAGLAIPTVSVNFSAEDLRDPMLADRLTWEVDRHDLRPGRLTVEILETVAAQADDDMVLRTIEQLDARGFNLDLDDFGTGHASLANIRRFRVNRIKIDRSFVTRIDQDAEQRAMVTAILAMAEHLGIETLAEGVETSGEHALLAQLGCRHVQGFGLARPMPFEETIAWAQAHARTWTPAARLGRRLG